MRWVCLFLAAVWLGGCGGDFILTAPDVVGLPGQRAAVVVRLQRREFWAYAPPLEGSAIMFRMDDGPLRSARTDEHGYAAVAMDMPDGPGQYEVSLHHQDLWGDTVSAVANIYVLPADTLIAAVDMDSLPDEEDAAPAAGALERVSRKVQIIYLAEQCAGADKRLSQDGYPKAPVMPWPNQRPWYRKMPWNSAPPDRIAALRKQLPGLKWGIAAEDDEAEAFLRGGLTVLAVGKFQVRGDKREGVAVHMFGSWSEVLLPNTGAD